MHPELFHPIWSDAADARVVPYIAAGGDPLSSLAGFDPPYGEPNERRLRAAPEEGGRGRRRRSRSRRRGAASRLRALTGEGRIARDLTAPAMAIGSNPLSSAT